MKYNQQLDSTCQGEYIKSRWHSLQIIAAQLSFRLLPRSQRPLIVGAHEAVVSPETLIGQDPSRHLTKDMDHSHWLQRCICQNMAQCQPQISRSSDISLFSHRSLSEQRSRAGTVREGTTILPASVCLFLCT